MQPAVRDNVDTQTLPTPELAPGTETEVGSGTDVKLDAVGTSTGQKSVQQRDWQSAVRGLQYKILPLVRVHLFHHTTNSKTGAR